MQAKRHILQKQTNKINKLKAPIKLGLWKKFLKEITSLHCPSLDPFSWVLSLPSTFHTQLSLGDFDAGNGVRLEAKTLVFGTHSMATWLVCQAPHLLDSDLRSLIFSLLCALKPVCQFFLCLSSLNEHTLHFLNNLFYLGFPLSL